MKKLLLVFVFVFAVWFVLPANVKAITTAELQAQIQSLIAQIAQLQAQLAQLQGNNGNNGVGWCHSFNKNLRVGDKESEVNSLKDALIKEGVYGGASIEANDFTEGMASAVSAFQEKYASEILVPYGLKKGTGYAGPSTRKKLNSLYGCKVACAMEAKQCSDGSYVSRSGPNCEFAQCPINKCKVDSDCMQPTCSSPISSVASTCVDQRVKCVSGKCVSSSKNFPPVISSVSGPTVLSVGQTGTWTVSASDPENGTLSYNVRWGDIESGLGAATQNQTATFTHSYSSAGNYIIYFYVKDNAGNIAQTSISVNVGNSTQQYLITIISPNGGETYKIGDTITVNWKTSNISSSQYLYVIRLREYPSGREYNLVYSTVNDGREIITLPSSVPAGSYTLEIKSYVNNVLVFDASDSYFKIVSVTQPSITVTSPNGGELWNLGETHRITWNSGGVSNVRIYVYDDSIYGSGSTNYITPNNNYIPASQGYFDWTIAQNQLPGGSTLPRNYKIRVDDMDNGDNVVVRDVSNNSFSIVSPNRVCTDSDITSAYSDGLNYFTKGYIATTLNSTPQWDYCINASDGQYVVEHNCSSPNGGAVQYKCPNGCSDGACWDAGAQLNTGSNNLASMAATLNWISEQLKKLSGR